MSNKLVPVDMIDLQSERNRALLEHSIKAWIEETFGMQPRRRRDEYDEYSDDSQVYIGDIFPEGLENTVP